MEANQFQSSLTMSSLTEVESLKKAGSPSAGSNHFPIFSQLGFRLLTCFCLAWAHTVLFMLLLLLQVPRSNYPDVWKLFPCRHHLCLLQCFSSTTLLQWSLSLGRQRFDIGILLWERYSAVSHSPHVSEFTSCGLCVNHHLLHEKTSLLKLRDALI